MNPPRISLLIPFLALLLAGCTGVPEGVQPVRGFNPERYLGTWHEIARLDHSFEQGLVQVTATYAKREDGGIDVLNRGHDPDKGVWKEVQGRAYFIAGPDLASLKVSFFGPFYGGYHVFALDPDYGWALISGPTREYFWILARQPQLPAEILDDLLDKARSAGFDISALIFPGSGPDSQVQAAPAGQS